MPIIDPDWHRSVSCCLQTSFELSWAVDVGCDYWTKVTLAIICRSCALVLWSSRVRASCPKLTLSADICILRIIRHGCIRPIVLHKWSFLDSHNKEAAALLKWPLAQVTLRIVTITAENMQAMHESLFSQLSKLKFEAFMWSQLLQLLHVKILLS